MIATRTLMVTGAVFVSSLFALSLQAQGGDVLDRTPFGFACGMTTDQIIHLVGRGAVTKTDGDALTLTTAPRPSAAFRSYLLAISPTQGLLRIDGHAASNNTVRSQYEDMREAISQTYGPASKVFGPTDDGRGYLYATFWKFKSTLPNRIQSIVLTFETDNSPLLLSYECSGYEEYAHSKKAQKQETK